MQTLLLGGTGLSGPFVGARLIERGHEVIVYHRGKHESEFLPPCEHIHGDRRDQEAFRFMLNRVHVDAVVDFGAMCGKDSEPVVTALRGRIQASVHVSSGDVYADLGEDEPVSESAPLREGPPYGGALGDYDKKSMEQTVLDAYRDGDFPATIIRYPVVYGPGKRNGYREWGLIKRALDRRTKLAIPERSFKRPLLRGYVENLAHGVVAALERAETAGSIYNISDSEMLTLAELAREIGRVLNHSWELVAIPDNEWGGLTYNGPEGRYDLQKAYSELGYEPPVEVREALCRTVRWQVDNPPRDPDPWNVSTDQHAYELEDRLIDRYSRASD